MTTTTTTPTTKTTITTIILESSYNKRPILRNSACGADHRVAMDDKVVAVNDNEMDIEAQPLFLDRVTVISDED